MLSFSNFLLKIENFKNSLPENHDSFNNSFSDYNYRVLKAACNRIQSAENDLFYTEDELTILIHANEMKEKAPKEINLLAMKQAVQISIKQKKYHAAMEEFNDPSENNIFSVFKKLERNNNEEKKRALEELENTWKRRRHLGHIPSTGLKELQETLDKLDIYVNMLKEDFNFNESKKILPFYWNNSNLAKLEKNKDTALQLINDLNTLIQNERCLIVKAMLERLALVPNDHLVNLTSNESLLSTQEIFNDDLVFNTLKSLLPFGLKDEYVEDFKQQAPPHQTLTDNLILQFNEFIEQYGTIQDKENLRKLYVTKPETVQNDLNFNVIQQPLEDLDTILIPTKIANQYNISIKTSNNFTTSFVYVENQLKDQPLDMSFYDVKEEATIHIPIEGLAHGEVEYKKEQQKEKLEEIYDVLTKETKSIPLKINVFREEKKLLNQLSFERDHLDIIDPPGVNLRQEFYELGHAQIKAFTEEDWENDPAAQFNTVLNNLKSFIELKYSILFFLNKEYERVLTNSNLFTDQSKTIDKINAINAAIVDVKNKTNQDELKDYIKNLPNNISLTQNRRTHFFCPPSNSTLKENLNEFIAVNAVRLN